jgi:hypothetical protein
MILRASPDISTLSTLVRSSPLYHKAYYGQRQSILHSVPSNTLSPRTLLEFQPVIKARRIGRGPSWLSDTEKFLDDYRKENLDTSYAIDLEDLVEIPSLLDSIQVVANEFFQLNFSKHPRTGGYLSIDFKDPSCNELRRVYGSLARFEICCALFGNIGSPKKRPADWTLTNRVRLTRLFLFKLALWEVEEIACVREFIFRWYSEVYRDCKHELLCMLRRLEASYWPLYTSGKQALGSMIPLCPRDYDAMSETLMSCELGLLSIISKLHNTGPDASKKKVSQIEKRFGYTSSFAFSSGTSFGNDGFLTDIVVTYMRTAVTQEMLETTMLEYTSDDDETSPSAAWLWLLKQDRAPYFNRHYHRMHFTGWGFVFWDQDRFEKMEISTIILGGVAYRQTSNGFVLVISMVVVSA